MAKSDRSYEIGRHDRDWIESVAEPIHPVLAEIEDAALPERIPILDRESGRVLALLASGRRRICEVGTAYGYSTLCMALAQKPDPSTTVTRWPARSTSCASSVAA